METCPVCREPKRAVIPETVPASAREILTKAGVATHPRPCKCEREARARAEREAKIQERRDTIRRNLETANIPDGYRHFGLGNLNLDSLPEPERRQLESAVETCRTFAAMKPGTSSLIIQGAVGKAKTHLAIATLKAVIETHTVSGLYWNQSTMMGRLRRLWGANQFEEAGWITQAANDVGMLVLDDIGLVRLDGKDLERFYEIVETRNAENRSWIVTTNCGASELARKVDERIVDRLFNRDRTVTIELTGASWRQRR